MNRTLYRKIARQHGVSVKEVKTAMQAAVDEVIAHAVGAVRNRKKSLV